MRLFNREIYINGFTFKSETAQIPVFDYIKNIHLAVNKKPRKMVFFPDGLKGVSNMASFKIVGGITSRLISFCESAIEESNHIIFNASPEYEQCVMTTKVLEIPKVGDEILDLNLENLYLKNNKIELTLDWVNGSAY